MIETLAELDRVRDECRKLVTKRAAISAGAAVVPVPGADMLTDIGLLTRLLPDINARFGLSADQIARLDPARAQRMLAIAGSLGNRVIGRMVTKELIVGLLKRIGVRMATKSAAKYVPLVGSAVAASVSFGAMKLLGNAHIADCYETVRLTLSDRETDVVAIAAKG